MSMYYHQWRRLHRAMGTCPPTFTNCWTWGVAPWVYQQQTDQTVLTSTKALTETTTCTCRAKKVGGGSTTKQNFLSTLCALFFIRSGATDYHILAACSTKVSVQKRV